MKVLINKIVWKITDRDRYLNALSHHQQKRVLVKTLFHRGEGICDGNSNEQKHTKWALKCSGFSDKDIQSARKVEQYTEPKTYYKYACLLYVHGVTNRIRKILKKKN